MKNDLFQLVNLLTSDPICSKTDLILQRKLLLENLILTNAPSASVLKQKQLLKEAVLL